LINTDLIRMVELRRMQEDEGLNRVKRKMERIKLRQERLHQKEPFDSDDHFVGEWRMLGYMVYQPMRV